MFGLGRLLDELTHICTGQQIIHQQIDALMVKQLEACEHASRADAKLGQLLAFIDARLAVAEEAPDGA